MSIKWLKIIINVDNDFRLILGRINLKLSNVFLL